MFLGVLVSAGAHACMCDFTWRLHNSLGAQDTVHLSEVRSLTALELVTSVGWLATKSQRAVYFCVSSMGMASIYLSWLMFFNVVLGTQPQISKLIVFSLLMHAIDVLVF